ncbi:putative syntaxin-like protein [Encephalitozoon romaleae SJ-2008]|uniref:Syntaxin-like protein n=1 Tax=Encephalitozoon romaleae (strain SJ-2008) TaxID=1178016 RepID=I7AED1_ENCRO|nr:putative syntaxin-like protein [Encephalitozoon romaleae SJ-2008]AFN83015.1 putative syntaxin-like protein [Encephalitozoon romaleae SJ-2008]
MDRTDEFVKIIQTTLIPQQGKPLLSSPYIEAFEIDTMIERTLSEISRMLDKERVYESFTLQSKIDRASELVGKMRDVARLEMRCRNDQEAASYANLEGMIKNRVSRYSIKLKEFINKRNERRQAISERRKEFDSECSLEHQDTVLMEREVVTERIKERQKISMQISEIGQIMEEISMHVSLQEESFRRIDDLMATSDSLISGSLDLMKKTWANVSGTRPAIIKFIAFWVVLALAFWLLRR